MRPFAEGMTAIAPGTTERLLISRVNIPKPARLTTNLTE